MPLVTARVIGRRHRPIRIWESREQFFTELGLGEMGINCVTFSKFKRKLRSRAGTSLAQGWIANGLDQRR